MARQSGGASCTRGCDAYFSFCFAEIFRRFCNVGDHRHQPSPGAGGSRFSEVGRGGFILNAFGKSARIRALLTIRSGSMIARAAYASESYGRCQLVFTKA